MYNISMMKLYRNHWGIVVLLGLSIFAIPPFFHSGFFTMHDDTQVARVYEMGKALKDGQFPVRIVQDLGYGFGYPIFNFYSPLPYYVGGALALIGIDALIATKITFVLAIVLSGVSMYIFIKSFFGELAAFVASVFYVYFPYHAVNIYVRGDLDELFAYALLPLALLGLFKIYINISREDFFSGNLRWMILFSLSLALIIISHNLTFFMISLFLILFILISFIFSKYRFRILYIYSVCLFLAFALSAFYALPAVFEIGYTNVKSQIGGGAHFADHFVCLPQLWDSPWGFGGSTKGCIDGISFRLGKIHVLLTVASFLFLGYISLKRKARMYLLIIYTSFVFLAFSIFMLLPISEFLWKTIPFSAFLQYPWRFLNFVGLFMSMVIGAAVFYGKSTYKNGKVFSFVIFLGVVSMVIFQMKLFKPQLFLARNSTFYTNISYLRWEMSKISDEYMPEYFAKPKTKEKVASEPLQIIYGNGEIKNVYAKTGYIRADIISGKDTFFRLNIAYFPAWRLRLDNKPLNFTLLSSALYFNPPPGRHHLEAKFITTQVELFSNIVSLLGGVLFVMLLLRSGLLGRTHHNNPRIPIKKAKHI